MRINHVGMRYIHTYQEVLSVHAALLEDGHDPVELMLVVVVSAVVGEGGAKTW
jgi:hypothetical protein